MQKNGQPFPDYVQDEDAQDFTVGGAEITGNSKLLNDENLKLDSRGANRSNMIQINEDRHGSQNIKGTFKKTGKSSVLLASASLGRMNSSAIDMNDSAHGGFNLFTHHKKR